MPKPQRPRIKTSQEDRNKLKNSYLRNWRIYGRGRLSKKAESLDSEAQRTGKSRTATAARFISELRAKLSIKALVTYIRNGSKHITFIMSSNQSVKINIVTLNSKLRRYIINIRDDTGIARITLALKNLGFTINHKCVQRLMQSMQLRSCIRAVKYRSYKGQIGKGCQECVAASIQGRQAQSEVGNRCN